RVLQLKADHPDAICGAGWAYAAEKTGFDKALKYLESCKGLSSTTASDKQLIDAKLKSIVAMQKAGAAQPAAEKPKDKPKAAGGAGGNMLDKVADEGAKESGGDQSAPAPAPAPAPQGGTPAPQGQQTPAAAPAPAPAPAPK